MPALTGDVTSSAGGVATTVAKIQSTTVSGTTGTTNAVFSASPTVTGTVTGANSNWSGNVGIGTTTLTQPLTVNGNIDIFAANSGYLTEVANAASTGTTVNKLSKLTTGGQGPDRDDNGHRRHDRRRGRRRGHGGQRANRHRGGKRVASLTERLPLSATM